MFRSLTFAALVAYTSAQSLSTQCTGALAAIAANPDANACLAPSALLSLVTSSNSSIVTPVDNWLSSLCGASSCSNATLASIVQNATTGCSAELGSLGFTSDLTPDVVNAVQLYYPTVRNVVCLKDGNTNCITQTLTNLQTALGVSLTLNNVIGLIANPPQDKIQAIVANKTLTCTNCIKAAYNEINHGLPLLQISSAAPALQSQCGATFTDNSTPAGISQSASTSTSGSNAAQSSASGNNAAAFLSTGAFTSIGVSALIAVGSAFALLA